LIRILPYAPELNPAEKVWKWITHEVSLKFFDTTKALQNKLTKMVHQRKPELIKSITGYEL
jgi:transposase